MPPDAEKVIVLALVSITIADEFSPVPTSHTPGNTLIPPPATTYVPAGKNKMPPPWFELMKAI